MVQDYLLLLGAIGTILTIAGYIWIRPRPDTHTPPKTVAPKPVLRDPLTYWLLSVNLIVTLILPIQLIAEFPVSAGQSRYGASANYIFYLTHYPHITVYPALFLGLAVLFAARAVNIYRAFSPPKAARRIAFALFVTLVATYWETTGHHMMLFEFNNDAQCGLGAFNDGDIVSKAKAIGLEDVVDPTRPMGQQVIAALSQRPVPTETTQRMGKLFNAYEAWNELGVQWRSASRTSYLTVFFCMTFVMLLGFCLLPFLPRSDKRLRDQDKVDASLSLNLLGGFFVYMLWIPFRIISNLNTKIPLFGAENIYDNFFQQLPLVSRFGITPADIVPVVAIPVFSTLLIFRLRRVSRRKTVMFLSSCGVLVVVGMAVLARVNSEAFLQIFGITGNLKGLAFRVLIATVLLLLIYQYVGSIPRDLDEPEQKNNNTR
jgi:hypothetical protein